MRHTNLTNKLLKCHNQEQRTFYKRLPPPWWIFYLLSSCFITHVNKMYRQPMHRTHELILCVTTNFAIMSFIWQIRTMCPREDHSWWPGLKFRYANCKILASYWCSKKKLNFQQETISRWEVEGSNRKVIKKVCWTWRCSSVSRASFKGPPSLVQLY